MQDRLAILAQEVEVELNRPLAVVTPTLDGDVLAVLAQHEAAFTTGQLHRVLTRFSEEGIRKVLQRLTRQGVVSVERVGQAYNYRLNEEHLAAGPIRALASMQRTLLVRLEQRLAGWPSPPVYACVFGSIARGSGTADSDLDVLLVRADDVAQDDWDKQVTALVSEVTSWTGNDTRPLQYTVDELIAARDEPVLRDAVRDALTVSGSRAWAHRHVAAAVREPPEVAGWLGPGLVRRRSAGAAFADVICCARLGKHAQGENHAEAVDLLRAADPDMARHLSTLLGMKTKAGYSHTSANATEGIRAGRAAEQLVEAARRAQAASAR